MEAKELRINNVVLKSGVIHPIGFYDFEDGGANFVLEDYQPIPLTEEWLVKFGFWNEVMDWYLDYKIGFNKDTLQVDREYSNEGEWEISTLYPASKWLTTIKYVHQLQNLFFALTNKELIIK